MNVSRIGCRLLNVRIPLQKQCLFHCLTTSAGHHSFSELALVSYNRHTSILDTSKLYIGNFSRSYSQSPNFNQTGQTTKTSKESESGSKKPNGALSAEGKSYSAPEFTDETSPNKPVNTSVPSMSSPKTTQELKEQIWNLPNILTIGRIALCPIIAYYIIKQDFGKALSLIAIAGISDALDGFLARRYNMKTAIGSILDPAADKILMATLVGALTYEGSIPIPLAIIIVGRDLFLSLWAFVVRYQTLDPPKTFKRYWNLTRPTAVVQPSNISKLNTFFQLSLVFLTIASPFIPSITPVLKPLQWLTGATTIISGLSYFTAGGGFKKLAKPSSSLGKALDKGKVALDKGKVAIDKGKDRINKGRKYVQERRSKKDK